MFTRPEQTYQVSEGLAKRILLDEAGPLRWIVGRIPTGATVLDIGAGSGLLAAVFAAAGKRVTIDAVEPDLAAVRIAQPHYRMIHRGLAQDHYETIRGEHYDFVVLADVLEHMNDPLRFLCDLAGVISTGATVMATVPNVAFGAVRLRLLHGDFAYADSGLLERTHLRFFTYATLVEMIRRSPFKLVHLCHLRRNFLRGAERPTLRPADAPAFMSIARDPLASTYQFALELSTTYDGTPAISYVGSALRWPLWSFVRYIVNFRNRRPRR